MEKRETKNLEYKKEVTKTYLKTVSAYANFGDGEIHFGVDDNGKIVGLDDPKKDALNIENQVNDSIKPVPNFTIDIDERNRTVNLTIRQGINKPYFYNGKAYKRSDSSSVEVDRFELSRLILEGNNEDFEALPAKIEYLEFKYLERKLIEKLEIKEINADILKTLSLYQDKAGYNIAAELLSDSNAFPGIEYIQFGSNINTIIRHENLSGFSTIEQLDKIMIVFEQLYVYEEINNAQRETVELVPVKAFREVIANAIVHREWDLKTSIKISMYSDRVEVVSPGGLPSGISEKEYLNGQVSLLRNPILGNVFFRLGYIEKFGTGIRRVLNSYETSFKKPEFEFSQNSILVKLPKLLKEVSNMSSDEYIIYNIMNNNNSYRRKDLEEKSGFNKDKVIRLVNKLIETGLVERYGSGPEAKYIKTMK